MFTGLIEAVGKILQKGNNYLVVNTVLSDIKIGDSIAVNGVCLTASKIAAKNIKFDVMPETFERSNLKFLRANSKVNLERAMLMGGRLDGHIVQGHVEGIGKLASVAKKDNARILKITTDAKILQNIIKKGSVAIEGISLTVVEKKVSSFSVSIIPETWAKTNLESHKIGDFLNIETDFLLKRDVNLRANNDKNMAKLLTEEGFL